MPHSSHSNLMAMKIIEMDVKTRIRTNRVCPLLELSSGVKVSLVIL